MSFLRIHRCVPTDDPLAWAVTLACSCHPEEHRVVYQLKLPQSQMASENTKAHAKQRRDAVILLVQAGCATAADELRLW